MCVPLECRTRSDDDEEEDDDDEEAEEVSILYGALLARTHKCLHLTFNLQKKTSSFLPITGFFLLEL